MSISEWNSREVLEWREKSTRFQSCFGEALRDKPYETFKSSDKRKLEVKIGICMFPEVRSFKKGATSILDLDYSDEQLKVITEIQEAIWKFENDGRVNVQIIFLTIITRKFETSAIPVFRVKRNSEVVFIDTLKRVYKSWEDFMSNNRLPECLFCYPEGGMYGQELQFATSNACKVQGKVLKTLDWTSIGAAVASSVATIALPVTGIGFAAAAAVVVASGLWGSGRSIATLVDRKKHEQSIGFKDSESRSAWFNIAGSAVGTATLGATSLFRLGRAARFARPTLIGCGVASASIGGTSIINSAWRIADKKSVDREDLMDLTLAIFFFTSTVYTFKTAASLKSAQTVETIAAAPIETAPSNQKIQGSRISTLQAAAPGGVLALTDGGYNNLINFVERYGGDVMRLCNKYYNQPKTNEIKEKDRTQLSEIQNHLRKYEEGTAANSPPDKAQSKSQFDRIYLNVDWLMFQHDIFQQIREKLFKKDYALFFDRIGYCNVFGRLSENEAGHFFAKVKKNVIRSERFDSVIHILIAAVRAKSSFCKRNKELQIFFLQLLYEFLLELEFESPTNDSLWERALEHVGRPVDDKFHLKKITLVL